MFTLRRISSEGIEMNTYLGDSYTLVHKLSNQKEFERSFKAVFNQEYDAEQGRDKDQQNVFAFVSGSDGSVFYPLYRNQNNYIMSSNGETFARITY